MTSVIADSKETEADQNDSVFLLHTLSDLNESVLKSVRLLVIHLEFDIVQMWPVD